MTLRVKWISVVVERAVPLTDEALVACADLALVNYCDVLVPRFARPVMLLHVLGADGDLSVGVVPSGEHPAAIVRAVAAEELVAGFFVVAATDAEVLVELHTPRRARILLTRPYTRGDGGRYEPLSRVCSNTGIVVYSWGRAIPPARERG